MLSKTPKLNIPDGPATIANPQPPGQTKPLPKPTKTGMIPFTVPGHGIKVETWYALWGDLSSSTPPLIVLHGGPGFCHNYLLPASHLGSAPFSRPTIMYDQFGCGNSTHLPKKMGDSEFWQPELFMAEIDNLKEYFGIKTFDLLGQSWGGMLGAQYAITQPAGLRKLVIADSPASMRTWLAVANELRKRLPEDVQETLTRCEDEGREESEEYGEAVKEFDYRFVCRIVPSPKEMVDSENAVKKDPTVYYTMNGPSEFHIVGNLKNWTIEKSIHKINVPTLLINGKWDEGQDVVMEPFFKNISGKVKWIRFGESSHCPHLEETDAWVDAVGGFLEG